MTASRKNPHVLSGTLLAPLGQNPCAHAAQARARLVPASTPHYEGRARSVLNLCERRAAQARARFASSRRRPGFAGRGGTSCHLKQELRALRSLPRPQCHGSFKNQPPLRRFLNFQFEPALYYPSISTPSTDKRRTTNTKARSAFVASSARSASASPPCTRSSFYSAYYNSSSDLLQSPSPSNSR